MTDHVTITLDNTKKPGLISRIYHNKTARIIAKGLVMVGGFLAANYGYFAVPVTPLGVVLTIGLVIVGLSIMIMAYASILDDFGKSTK